MKSWPRVVVPLVPKADKPLTIYSTDRQSIVSLPLKDTYQIYVCGITPYDATHLGHAATYLAFDILIRYWLAQGSNVNYIQNITDIDDPLLERAKRDQKDWQALADSQIDLFRSDMQALRILPPNHYEGAVAAIPEVLAAIEALKNSQTAYQVDQDLYFDISKDPNFGFESKLDEDDMRKIFAERGGDPERVGKQNPLDALLWLAKRPDEPSWPSKFGEGRPGWHIECAAIALKFAVPDAEYILDVQGGGSDLIFPHHEMSASQTKALTGKSLARAYVHAGMIGLDGEKMSKSRGNLLFISKLISSGISPISIRWALLKRHYRQDYMWQGPEFDIATKELNILFERINNPELPAIEQLIADIYLAIASDLDTPTAIAKILEWCTQTTTLSKEPSEDRVKLLNVLDALLGIKIVFE